MTIPVFLQYQDFTKYAAISLNSLVKHADREKDYTVHFSNQDLAALAMKMLM